MKETVFLSDNEDFVPSSGISSNLISGMENNISMIHYIHKQREQGPTVTPWATSRLLQDISPAPTAPLSQQFSALATNYNYLTSLKNFDLMGFGKTQASVFFKSSPGDFDVQTGLRTAVLAQGTHWCKKQTLVHALGELTI